MKQIRRLAGGLIDRNTPLSFEFNGKRFEGYHGDTLASALIANGQTLVGRSFKYHRPRGIFSAGSEEPNALVELRKGAFKSRIPGPPLSSYSTSSARKAKIIVAL